MTPLTGLTDRATVVAAATTAGAMIAFPLARRGGSGRRTTTHVVVSGLFATTTAGVARRWGWARAAIGTAAVGAMTTAVEHVGTSTGVPFGRYRYTGRLRPRVAGVPLLVPMAWWSMAAPAREAAHAALGRRSTPARRVGLGAVALTAWDLFLDPQMTAEGYWHWARRGRYRGIPLTNFAGWLVTAAAVMAVLELVIPPDGADRALVGEYAAMGVMETMGFAAFFRDPLVAATGALGMLPVAAAGVVGMARG